MESNKQEYKGYIIWRDKVYCHYHIRHDGKGSVPDALDSSYTKLELAKQAIDRYRELMPLEAPVSTAKAKAATA